MSLKTGTAVPATTWPSARDKRRRASFIAAMSTFCGHRVWQVWHEVHSQIMRLERTSSLLAQLHQAHEHVRPEVGPGRHRAAGRTLGALEAGRQVSAGGPLDERGKGRGIGGQRLDAPIRRSG